MYRRFGYLLTAVILLAALLMPAAAMAFGDFDSGGDFGGYDSGYDSGGSSYDHDWDYDYDSSGRGSGDVSNAMKALVIIMIVIFIMIDLNQDKKRSRSRMRQTDAYDQRPLQAPDDLDMTALDAFVRQLFTDMQTGWEAGDIRNVRDRFDPDLWQTYDTQLQGKNIRGEQTHVRDIRFGSLILTDYRKQADLKYEVTVRVTVDSNIWTVNRSGKNILGTPSRRVRQVFDYTLHQVTADAPAPKFCTHCGAEVDASVFASCPNCGAPLTRPPKVETWRLSKIKAVAQQTIHH